MDQTFYALHRTCSQNLFARIDRLRTAASTRGLSFVSICEETADYTCLPTLQHGDMLFNVGRGASRLETLLSMQGIVSLRTRPTSWLANDGDTTIFSIEHDRLGLPAPKTVHLLPRSLEMLGRCVEYLNGPPIVFKRSGGSEGVGICLASDWPAIHSLCDYFAKSEEPVMLREFIEHQQKVRVYVLGSEVLCKLVMPTRDDDFRSSTTTYSLFAEEVPDLESIAIRATQACEYEFAGVDFVLHPDRGPLLIEVNPPCNFLPVYDVSDVDIAARIVDHLLEKFHQLLGAT